MTENRHGKRGNTQRIVGAILLMLLAAGCSTGWDPDESDRAIREAKETIERFRKTDAGLQAFFDQAYAYAVFPNIGKGGMVVGGAWGKGKVFRGGHIIGSTTMTQVTLGAQLGGQSYSELIFFKDKNAFDRFQSNQLEFDAQVSAIAVEYGAAAKANYEKGVAVFVLPKAGLMFEASIGGQAFTFTPET